MRALILILAIGQALLSMGCATSTYNQRMDALATHASFDMECPQDDIELQAAEGEAEWFAEGCGKRTRYRAAGACNGMNPTSTCEFAAARGIMKEGEVCGHCNDSKSSLLFRASLEMGCGKEQLESSRIGYFTAEVRGCEKRASFVCHAWTVMKEKTCTNWYLNSPVSPLKESQ